MGLPLVAWEETSNRPAREQVTQLTLANLGKVCSRHDYKQSTFVPGQRHLIGMRWSFHVFRYTGAAEVEMERRYPAVLVNIYCTMSSRALL